MSDIRDDKLTSPWELKCTTGFTDDGVYQEYTDLVRERICEFTELRIASRDKAIRQKLIELGWTPPAD